jgi:uncharacterized damage-inducible protein DinB
MKFMSRIKVFLKELENESVVTKKMLSRIPDDRYEWQPHPKSMTVKTLAGHIAELPTWITLALTTDELDFETAPYTPPVINNTADVMELFEKSLANGRSELIESNETNLDDPWTMRSGTVIYSTDPRADVIRMTLNQIVHHRAQMGVYLRLLNIPIPGSYGPSADEQ